MSACTHVLHTVAVYLPDSNTRVLVTGLAGSDAEVRSDARQHVELLAAAPRRDWLSKVVASDVITDIDIDIPPTENA